jgi:hypothetical protein
MHTHTQIVHDRETLLEQMHHRTLIDCALTALEHGHVHIWNSIHDQIDLFSMQPEKYPCRLGFDFDDEYITRGDYLKAIWHKALEASCLEVATACFTVMATNKIEMVDRAYNDLYAPLLAQYITRENIRTFLLPHVALPLESNKVTYITMITCVHSDMDFITFQEIVQPLVTPTRWHILREKFLAERILTAVDKGQRQTCRDLCEEWTLDETKGHYIMLRASSTDQLEILQYVYARWPFLPETISACLVRAVHCQSVHVIEWILGLREAPLEIDLPAKNYHGTALPPSVHVDHFFTVYDVVFALLKPDCRGALYTSNLKGAVGADRSDIFLRALELDMISTKMADVKDVLRSIMEKKKNHLLDVFIKKVDAWIDDWNLLLEFAVSKEHLYGVRTICQRIDPLTVDMFDYMETAAINGNLPMLQYLYTRWSPSDTLLHRLFDAIFFRFLVFRWTALLDVLWQLRAWTKSPSALVFVGKDCIFSRSTLKNEWDCSRPSQCSEMILLYRMVKAWLCV